MKFLAFFISCLTLGHALAQTFLPKTEDIPFMPGLKQVEEVANFDTPKERMLILSATSTSPQNKIQKFYQTNLTNLGWTKVKENTYQRDKDTFQIEMKKESNQIHIQFILTQE